MNLQVCEVLANVEYFDEITKKKTTVKVRIPMVLRTLHSYFGEEKINRNVDGEEGGAFGAAYYALMQGLGRMKKSYKVRDFVPIDWYINSPYLEKEMRLVALNKQMYRLTLASYKELKKELTKRGIIWRFDSSRRI